MDPVKIPGKKSQEPLLCSPSGARELGRRLRELRGVRASVLVGCGGMYNSDSALSKRWNYKLCNISSRNLPGCLFVYSALFAKPVRSDFP